MDRGSRYASVDGGILTSSRLSYWIIGHMGCLVPKDTGQVVDVDSILGSYGHAAKAFLGAPPSRVRKRSHFRSGRALQVRLLSTDWRRDFIHSQFTREVLITNGALELDAPGVHPRTAPPYLSWLGTSISQTTVRAIYSTCAVCALSNHRPEGFSILQYCHVIYIGMLFDQICIFLKSEGSRCT